MADAVGAQATAEAARSANSAAVVFAQGKSSRNNLLGGTDGMVSVAPNENMTGRDFSGFPLCRASHYAEQYIIFVP